MSFTKQSSVESFSFKIHMAGDFNDALRICRKFCQTGALHMLRRNLEEMAGGRVELQE